MNSRPEPELNALRKLAEDLARGRTEKMSTAHLLAAIAAHGGSAADLLTERRLDADVLLRAARVVTDDRDDAMHRALQRAKELAARGSARAPGGLHLLFALCQERTCAAYRAIEQCGSDVTKLRGLTMQLATGIVAARRANLSQAAAIPSATRDTRPPPPAQTLALEPRTPPRPILAPTSPVVAQPPPMRPPLSPPAPTIPRARRTRGLSGGPRVMPPAPHGATPIPERFTLDPKQFPKLAQLGRNLTREALMGTLDPVVGRDDLVELLLDVLAKRSGNSPCLIGAAGVGKTSVVRALAQRIADRSVPGGVDDRTLVEVDSARLLSGTGVRGALAERLLELTKEAKKSDGKVVVFFDDIHVLLGSGANDEGTAELRLALARGELLCIGATSLGEFRRITEEDSALARRFTAIEVPELGPDAAIEAVRVLVPRLEAHHGLAIQGEVLADCVVWTHRYMSDRPLPDKALSVLDLAAARSRRRGGRELPRVELAEVVSELSAVPVERLLETDGERMLRLEELLAERVVGHESALKRIAAVLRRNATGFRSARPIGTFLLLGPTGVGKTESAKAIAEALFFSPHAMTRLDFSEFAESHTIARLVGSPPGYVGHEAGGQLTEAMRRKPYQVLLLDEIEKAHRDVLEAFLQVFDEGRLTDGRGRTVDFSNAVIVMTSNLGSEHLRASPRSRIGFGAAADASHKSHTQAVLESVKQAIPLELYNRIDEVLVYGALSREDIAEVARRMLDGLAAELARGRKIALRVDDDVIDALLEEGGFDAELGARPMRRIIGRLIETPIAELILRGELSSGAEAVVETLYGKIQVRPSRGSAHSRMRREA